MHGGEKRGKEMSIIFGNIIFFPYLCSIYTNHMINIRKLETELWESADLLRQGSKLTSSQYCMPVLALLFLRYAYSRYKMVEAEILQSRPMRGGRVMPVEPSDFAAKSALYLPKEAQCDYVMANPPFNVDKVKAESASAAGRLPFGLPGVNAKTKEVGNANYLWISYFYAYLNDHGRAGFVMASSATDSANKDRDIREKLVRTGDVDVMV